MFLLLSLLIFCCAEYNSVLSLHSEDVEEGSCGGTEYQPVQNTDFSFIDRFRYVPAGNRYHLYRTASAHPNFQNMREYEFYYGLCLFQGDNYSLREGTALGFGGRVLGRYTFRPRSNQPEIIDFNQYSSNDDGTFGELIGKATQTITLTDNSTFVFLATCWTDTNQKSWNVLSLTNELSASSRSMIEQHAQSLGFSSDEFVFLKYDSCETTNNKSDDANLSRLLQRKDKNVVLRRASNTPQDRNNQPFFLF